MFAKHIPRKGPKIQKEFLKLNNNKTNIQFKTRPTQNKNKNVQKDMRWDMPFWEDSGVGVGSRGWGWSVCHIHVWNVFPHLHGCQNKTWRTTTSIVLIEKAEILWAPTLRQKVKYGILRVGEVFPKDEPHNWLSNIKWLALTPCTYKQYWLDRKDLCMFLAMYTHSHL